MIEVPINQQRFGLNYDYRGEVTSFTFNNREDLRYLIRVLQKKEYNLDDEQ